MNEEFYITLPTRSNCAEFPYNQTNHFKVDLPHPIGFAKVKFESEIE